MAVTLMNPEGLPKPDVYRQLRSLRDRSWSSSPGRSPATPTAIRWEPTTSPLRSSSRCSTSRQLTAAGGTFDDVAKLTVYVVDWSAEKYPLLGEGVARAAAKLGINRSSRSL